MYLQLNLKKFLTQKFNGNHMVITQKFNGNHMVITQKFNGNHMVITTWQSDKFLLLIRVSLFVFTLLFKIFSFFLSSLCLFTFLNFFPYIILKFNIFFFYYKDNFLFYCHIKMNLLIPPATIGLSDWKLIFCK